MMRGKTPRLPKGLTRLAELDSFNLRLTQLRVCGLIVGSSCLRTPAVGDQQRHRLLQKVRTVVIKVGTAVLSREDGFLDRQRVEDIAAQVHKLREGGMRVVIVSSGAIGAGMAELGMQERPTDLPRLQAAAAVGQGKLIRAYDTAFRKHGYHAAQILLTRQDFDDRTRYLNASNTLHALMDLGAVPVVNENDTTSVEEVTFSDNDILAALVANLLSADLFVILTVVDGLLDPGKGSAPIPIVEEINDEIRQLASGETSAGGLGGMTSKLQAAEMVTSAGEAVIIANGHTPDVLGKLLNGEPIGTLFLPTRSRMASKKRWIRFGGRPRGKIIVDAGAEKALVQGGKSLLPSGIVEVKGKFERGVLAEVIGPSGREIARGLVNYSAHEIDAIRGLQSSSIEKSLGAKPYDEVIHRDNLTVSCRL